MSEASKSTQGLVDDWVAACRDLERAKAEENAAGGRLWNAATALGRRIAPDDASEGERIAIWVRLDRKSERLLVVTKGRGDGEFSIAFRGSSRERGEEQG